YLDKNKNYWLRKAGGRRQEAEGGFTANLQFFTQHPLFMSDYLVCQVPRTGCYAIAVLFLSIISR
ncbi:MAG: hypothetical protein AB4426_18605, partial [Xenococcaceae cyanobacterium]